MFEVWVEALSLVLGLVLLVGFGQLLRCGLSAGWNRLEAEIRDNSADFLPAGATPLERLDPGDLAERWVRHAKEIARRGFVMGLSAGAGILVLVALAVAAALGPGLLESVSIQAKLALAAVTLLATGTCFAARALRDPFVRKAVERELESRRGHRSGA